jgi:hypothetical protein
MSLSEIFDFLRKCLTTDGSLYKLFCVYDPSSDHVPAKIFGSEYAAFISRLSDGGRFGVVDLWSGSELMGNQFRVTEPEKYVEIGQVLYEPLLMDKDSQVYWSKDEVLRSLGSFDCFLRDYVFGSGYLALSATADDPWWSLMLQNGICEER